MLYVCDIIDEYIGVMDDEKRKVFYYTEEDIMFMLSFNIKIEGVKLETYDKLKIQKAERNYVIVNMNYDDEEEGKIIYTISVNYDEEKVIDYCVYDTGEHYVIDYGESHYVFEYSNPDKLFECYPFDVDLCAIVATTAYNFEFVWD